MKHSLVRQIADAVLYEGYILYPYRPSVKSQQRWTFGGLYPRAYSEANQGTDAWKMQTECLILGSADTTVDVLVRFLHPLERTIGKLPEPLDSWQPNADSRLETVGSLPVGERVWHPWQEAAERELPIGKLGLGSLQAQPQQLEWTFAASRKLEPLHEPGGRAVGAAIRLQTALMCAVEVEATLLAESLYKLSVWVSNATPFEAAAGLTRDEAASYSMASTHTILEVQNGSFLSLIDPPEPYGGFVAECQNQGSWPVLVGNPGDCGTLLCPSIILGDYPQIAPESPGDLFDGLEIDEILSLRILTLTDAEKRAMAAVDERAAALLQRTESLAREQLLGLHGVMRSPREA